VVDNEGDIKNDIFTIVQDFLENPPLIVWGSGATIPFGLPSMEDLNAQIKEKIYNFNESNANLETELGKKKYHKKMPKIKEIIWEKVNQADISVLEKIISNNTNDFNGIVKMIKKFIETHPQVVNIITTNYDRVLEHVMSYNDISFTDGFNGKTLSIFDDNKFKDNKIVNLVKVHGSLNWFDISGETRFLPSISKNKIPKIITPSKKKYEETHHSPYRELIQKSDNLIKRANSFLVVGFGFNDEHLTPKIEEKIKKGAPIVLITKNVSPSSFTVLKDATKYILFEKSENSKTKVIYKKDSKSEKQEVELNGNFWELDKFMEIL
jgi:adenylate kinase